MVRVLACFSFNGGTKAVRTKSPVSNLMGCQPASVPTNTEAARRSSRAVALQALNNKLSVSEVNKRLMCFKYVICMKKVTLKEPMNNIRSCE